MSPEQVVRELWSRIQAHDWDGLGELLAQDVRVEWPSTAEAFVGRANFVAVQSEYPAGWSIRVLRVLAVGDAVVSEVEVPFEPLGLTFRVASFFHVNDGCVISATEYWVTVGGEEPPAWRQRYAAGT
jgi:ketosteroid isomerase-like protein